LALVVVSGTGRMRPHERNASGVGWHNTIATTTAQSDSGEGGVQPQQWGFALIMLD
jgi:hypothetical protein